MDIMCVCINRDTDICALMFINISRFCGLDLKWHLPYNEKLLFHYLLRFCNPNSIIPSLRYGS